MQSKTDKELLDSFVAADDGSAFAELVARYSPMVYRACRRLLGNDHDAEDATQAAFVVLARKAGSLRQEGRLNGWLHRVARLVALEALQKRTDRERHQTESVLWQESLAADLSEADRETVLRQVDTALDSLSAVLREAVVLRHLRGFSEQEAAAQAGCAVSAMKWRTSDGLAKLRARLAKRGVSLGGVALASLLTSESSASVPETLLPSILATVKTAAATTAAGTVASTTAGMLAKGAMKAMFIAKAKMVAAVAAASLVVAGSGAIVAQEVAQRKAAERLHGAQAAVPAKPIAELATMNVDEIDLMTVTSLTPAQAAAIVKRQEGKPSLPVTVEDQDAALRTVGATPEQIQGLRPGIVWLPDSVAPFILAESLGNSRSPEEQRLANGFAEFLDLPSLTTLTPDVAAELAKFKGKHFNLLSLTTLSADAAKAIAMFNGKELNLTGLTTLDADTAKALAQFKGGSLTLKSLSMLSVDTAKALAEYKGQCLNLRAPTTLSAGTAKALAQFKGDHLMLKGLTTIDAAAAKALAEFEGQRLALTGLTTLSADTAKALAQFKGEMLLFELTTLSADAAKALAEFIGQALYLDGLTTLSADTAEALAGFKGQALYLGDLTTLSPEAAAALAKCKAAVKLPLNMTLPKP